MPAAPGPPTSSQTRLQRELAHTPSTDAAAGRRSPRRSGSPPYTKRRSPQTPTNAPLNAGRTRNHAPTNPCRLATATQCGGLPPRTMSASNWKAAALLRSHPATTPPSRLNYPPPRAIVARSTAIHGRGTRGPTYAACNSRGAMTRGPPRELQAANRASNATFCCQNRPLDACTAWKSTLT